MTRAVMLEKVLSGYSRSYDIDTTPIPEMTEIAARGAFHVEDTAYIVSRKAAMWVTKSDEYVWFFSVEHLTDADCARFMQYVYETGMPLIHPESMDGRHMCTRLAMVVLCDTADEDALKRIKKCRLHKYFKFSLGGWMEFHAAAMVVPEKKVVANGYGRETAHYLNRLLHPKKRSGRGMRGLHLFKRMMD